MQEGGKIVQPIWAEWLREIVSTVADQVRKYDRSEKKRTLLNIIRQILSSC